MSRDRLKALIEGSVHKGEVTLASGKKRDFYVDGRLVTLTTEGSLLVAQQVLNLVFQLEATAVAGPTTGACPMVSATGILARLEGRDLKLAYIRAVAKDHGLQKTIEGGPLTPDDRVLLVDDVLTSGGSLIRAAFELYAGHGVKVEHAFVMVDRQAGGKERLAEAGLTLHSLFTRADLQS